MPEYLPVGPLQTSSEESPKAPNNYHAAVRRWRDAAYEEALQTSRLNDELQQIPEYLKAIKGQYWNPRRPKYRSPFYTNRLNKARVDNLSLLTDSRPVIDVTPNYEDGRETADILHNILKYEWGRQDMDLSLVTAADVCNLTGTAFWKLGGNTPGSLTAVTCGPENVMPVQPGFHLQQSTALLYQTWKPVGWYKRVHPWTSEGIEYENSFSAIQTTNPQYQRPDSIDEYVWNGLSPAMQRALQRRPLETGYPQGTGTDIFKTVQCQEWYIDDHSVNDTGRPVLMKHPHLGLDKHNWWYYVEPGQRLYPRKRLIVYGGNKLLYDGPSPYWHGLYPFSCLRLNPIATNFWGLSKYRDLLPIGQAINEICAGFMDMTRRALNPTAVSKVGAIPGPAFDRWIQDMPGMKLYMGPNANINDVKLMDPPNIPSWVLTFLQMVLLPEFDRMAGTMEVGALGRKKQVPAGETIEQMRDMLNTSTRLEERYMEAFVRDAGRQAISNIFQFFTLEKRLAILGGKGISKVDFDDSPRSLVPGGFAPKQDYWKNFEVSIVAGSLHGGAKDREKQIAMALAARHQISLQELWRRMELSDEKRAEMLKELLQEAQMMPHAPAGRSPRSVSQKKGAVA